MLLALLLAVGRRRGRVVVRLGALDPDAERARRLARPWPSRSWRRRGSSVRDGAPAYSETVAAGRVLSTDPGPGERVLDGGAVTIVLSLGKERYEVPKLRGMTEDEAQDALADLNLEFGESIGRWSETVPKGTILGSDPEPGHVAAARLDRRPLHQRGPEADPGQGLHGQVGRPRRAGAG